MMMCMLFGRFLPPFKSKVTGNVKPPSDGRVADWLKKWRRSAHWWVPPLRNAIWLVGLTLIGAIFEPFQLMCLRLWIKIRYLLQSFCLATNILTENKVHWSKNVTCACYKNCNLTKKRPSFELITRICFDWRSNQNTWNWLLHKLIAISNFCI